ncbi:MAG TPA: hypothetical protein P5262_04650 [Candidatus Moranbacteria bacterium]|nr:hypothetical protein [Candidatus Moranbacteria bacterium]
MKPVEQVFPKMEMVVEGIKKGSVVPVLRWEQKFQHGYPELELGIFDYYFKPWGTLIPVHNPFPVEFNVRVIGSDGKEIFIPEGSLLSVFSADTGEMKHACVSEFMEQWKEKVKEEEEAFEGWIPLRFYDNNTLRPASYHGGVFVRYSYKILYYMPSLAKIMFV